MDDLARRNPATFEMRVRAPGKQGDEHVKRREFLRTAGGVSLAGAMGGFVGAVEPAPLDVESLFEANRPEVLALAERVMQKCVFEKTMPSCERSPRRPQLKSLTAAKLAGAHVHTIGRRRT